MVYVIFYETNDEGRLAWEVVDRVLGITISNFKKSHPDCVRIIQTVCADDGVLVEEV